ncbi:deferrochelatase/peroxidase EfeB [Escherichia coli]|nr:deferrochelatase/peroxidase EfeB [Escherichia coli]
MTINFRRNALQLSVAALFSSAFMANAADVPQVKVTVTDKQCEPMTITVNAGKTQFIIQNHSQKALEWEILKGVMVVEERENIAPGFSQKMTANLQPGEYDMTCGLLTNPKGKLIVKGEATADAAQSDALLRFDERFGLAPQMPKKLQKMTRFPNDSLDAALCHGDVLLQICANTQDTVIHALRDIIKHTPDLLSVRWKREGFISDHAARSKGKETPINLLGFKDGTANPDSQNDKLMQKVVWVTADQQEPAWTIGGSYQAVRLIQFRVEFWDRTPLKEQQTIFGRDKQTGAPLGMQHEHDVPDYASDPEGKGIALDSHIRLANPRTAESESSLMLRRGYSYSLGVTNSGQLDMGLLFVCYQHDLEKGFLTVQKRLNGEALEEYVKPIGGGYFFALPGVKDANDYLGSALLRV